MASGTTGTPCSPRVSCSPVPGFGVLPCAGAYALALRLCVRSRAWARERTHEGYARTSYRSNIITLSQALTKSRTNFSSEPFSA